MYRLSSILMLFALSGCGGSDDASSNSNNSNNSGNNSVQSINAQDVIKFSKPDTTLEFSLHDYIELSSPSSNVKLSSMIPVLSASSPHYCREYGYEGLSITINATEMLGECVYEYTVEADGISADPSLMRVVFSSGETGPIRIAATTSIGDSITIDVSDYIPVGYSLDKDSLLLLGPGSVMTEISGNNQLKYTAGDYEGDAGIARILFNMKGDTNDKIIVATVDVAVSENGVNHAPIASNFRYGNVSSFTSGQQLDYKSVGFGDSVVIDIAPYFNKDYLDSSDRKIEMVNDQGEYFYDDNGNKINFYLEQDGDTTTNVYRPGLTLIDPDKHPVQLIDVYSYNAMVSPVQLNGEYTSTKFSFKSLKAGLNYVTYVLSDHNGGYATGIIEINVLSAGTVETKPWAGFLNTPIGRFSSPVDTLSAVEKNFSYTDSSVEDGINGPIGMSTPLFTYEQARLFCNQQDLELPTKSEVTKLKSYFPMGLYKSLNAYADDPAARSKEIGWPTTSSYWIDNGDVSVTSKSTIWAYMYDFTIGSMLNSYAITRPSAVTCISRYLLDRAVVPTTKTYRLPHGQSTAKVIIYGKDYAGSPAVGALVTASGGPSVKIRAMENALSPMLRLGNDGGGMFYVGSNLPSNNTEITFKHALSKLVAKNIVFLDVPKYVRAQRNLTQNVNTTLTFLCYYNTIESMADGRCPLGEYSSSSIPDWDGVGYSSFFYDGEYAYRKLGNAIYGARDFGRIGKESSASYDYANYYGVKYDLARADALVDKNPIFYDYQYFWVVNDKKMILEAYSRVSDIAKQINIKKTIPIEGSDVNEPFVYDPIEKVYWRANSYIEGKQRQLRSYQRIEDAAAQVNYLKEVPFSTNGGYTFTILK